jgi:hypothetical protein
VDPVRLVRVVGEWPGAALVPPVSLKLDLEAPEKPAGAKVLRAPGGPKAAGHRVRPAGAGAAGQSWWTARATAGEVTAGFTKEDILRRPETDPRAAGGMFSRLEQLLRALGS